MESRLIELEIKLSFAEDLIDELNRNVFRQQQQIDILVHEIGRLRDQVQSAQPQEIRNLRDEIPPHY